MRIRAITLFLGRKPQEHDELLSAFPTEVDRAARDRKLEVWTERLALAPISTDELHRIVDELPKSMLVAIPAMARDQTDVRTIAEAMDGHDDLFISIWGGQNELMLFSSLLKRAFSELGPEACTRISFTVGKPLLTPYFPSASARGGELGLAASLLYANDVRKALASRRAIEDRMKRCYKSAHELLRALSARLNVQSYGVDMSLSPWMEESVARLVEKLGGCEFGGPGSHHAVHELSEALRSVASSGDVRAVGFNEVMLPYAEDSRLLELGAEGKLTAYSLLSLAPVCVAGLDMVVVPYRDEGELERFLKDAYALLHAKGRPSGIRVVLASGEPGDVVHLKRFGRVTVMRLK